MGYMHIPHIPVYGVYGVYAYTPYTGIPMYGLRPYMRYPGYRHMGPSAHMPIYPYTAYGRIGGLGRPKGGQIGLRGSTWIGPEARLYNARARNVRACPRARARGMNPRTNHYSSSRLLRRIYVQMQVPGIRVTRVLGKPGSRLTRVLYVNPYPGTPYPSGSSTRLPSASTIWVPAPLALWLAVNI